MKAYTDRPRRKAAPTKFVGGAGHFAKRGSKKSKATK